MRISQTYRSALLRTAAEKRQLSTAYKSLTGPEKELMAGTSAGGKVTLPIMLARFYCERILEAVNSAETPFTDLEETAFANIIDLYMRYNDAKDSGAVTWGEDVTWDELPEEARFDFVNYG